MPALANAITSTLATSALPPDSYTAQRFFQVRDQLKLASSSGINISKNAITYFVCLGIAPIFLVTCIVIWALCVYGRARACCSCCNKRKEKNKLLQRQDPDNGSNISKKPMPMRESPARHDARLLTAVREDSGLTILSECSEEHQPSVRRFV
jgi:hypothetical protein